MDKLHLVTDVRLYRVMQWHWHTANSWACEGSECGLGYGEQEEFYGCADFAIIPSGVPPPTSPPTTKPTTKATTKTPVCSIACILKINN